MTVLQDQTAHKHICPICDKEYFCTEKWCIDDTFIMCDECAEND
jgi:hypothetical protein